MRDTAMHKLLNHFGMSTSLIVYNLITSNPIEIVLQLLTAKFGLSKAVVTIIIIFLI